MTGGFYPFCGYQHKIIYNTLMSQSSLPPQFKHQKDSRTETEKVLSMSIVRILTELNLKRIRDPKYQVISDNINKEQFHFICLCGLPPMKGEFLNLDLPGQKTILTMIGLDKEYSPQQYPELINYASFQSEASRIRKIVQQKSKTKKIVLVYHSFGTYIGLVYLDIYRKDPRISGIIDIGGAPITAYPVLINIIKSLIGITMQQVIQNLDSIFDAHIKSDNNNINHMENKYQLCIFFKYILSHRFHNMFEVNRNLPQVLKLIIYGGQDVLFTQSLLTQKIIYYCEVNRLPNQLQNKYKERYNHLFGSIPSNIQERFCLRFEKGKHSLHMQKKINSDIKLAISQYLSMIQEAPIN